MSSINPQGVAAPADLRGYDTRSGSPLIVGALLQPETLREMVTAVQSESFPWERSEILRGDFPGLDPQDNLQFVHGFYAWKNRRVYRSPLLHIIAPVLNCFGPMRLIKAKLNKTPGRPRHIEYGLHVDTRHRGALTAIYYLNDNNGYTLFEDGTRIASVANRLVIFNAALRHTGASCTDQAARLVLNLNLIPDTPELDDAQRR